VSCGTSRVVPGAHQIVGPGTHRGSGPREVHTTTTPFCCRREPHYQEPQPLFSPVQRRNYCLLYPFFLSFFIQKKKKEEKNILTERPLLKHHVDEDPATPPDQGRGRVSGRDARCRLQEGHDADVPMTSSPDCVRRKGFSPESSPPSSEKGWRHQRRRCGAAKAPPHDRRHGHHHDVAGARSHNNRGRPCHHSTADPPLHITRAPRHPPAPRPPETLLQTPPRCRDSNHEIPPRLHSWTTRGPARRGHKGTDPATGARIWPPMDGARRGWLEAGCRRRGQGTAPPPDVGQGQPVPGRM
jgi:hypothetical protein